MGFQNAEIQGWKKTGFLKNRPTRGFFGWVSWWVNGFFKVVQK
jgi:hypothetical protein